MRTFLFVVGIFLVQTSLTGQEIINLTNPSFEDVAKQGSPPLGWTDCGFPSESPPDVQPSDNPDYPYFDVTKAAFQGKTYLGMVVRDNDTWELVSQRLSAPIQAGKCYEFSLYLCRSELYVSQSRTTFLEANYTTPAKLRIWAGSGYCNKKELLAETSVVNNTRWLKFDFRFEPKASHTYIVLEAFYNTPVLFPYNGNILVDNASPIMMIPCEDETAIAAETPKPAPVVKPETPTTPDTPTTPNTSATAENKPKVLELDRKNLKPGATIRIEQLYFEADSAEIKAESFNVLDELYDFLNENRDVIVEIGGHTNGNPPHEYCDRLSTARAKAVAEYLIARGIPAPRLQYKGYGKRVPVASNQTPDGRRLNQRVEIKILSIDG